MINTRVCVCVCACDLYVCVCVFMYLVKYISIYTLVYSACAKTGNLCLGFFAIETTLILLKRKIDFQKAISFLLNHILCLYIQWL